MFLIIGVCELISRSMFLVRLRIWSDLTSSRLTLLGSILFRTSITLEEADDRETSGAAAAQLLLSILI